jgi:hypothetical protein
VCGWGDFASVYVFCLSLFDVVFNQADAEAETESLNRALIEP